MFKLLVCALLALGIAAAFLLKRILDLSSRLHGDSAGDDEISDHDNKRQASFMLLMLIGVMVFVVYNFVELKKYLLPASASLHGVSIDILQNTTFAIISVVFVITQILLFVFAYKYAFSKNRRGYFFPDNHKLELVWTVIPAIALVSLVVWGLFVWDGITNPAKQDTDKAMKVELYAKQFDWTARYAGRDNLLGRSNYRLIAGTNALGVDSSDKNSYDDVIAGELHLPANTPVMLYFRSREVIHSAYLPHFRLQMNCVPGMTTQFYFVPTKTTDEMRKITGDSKFDYILLCNKICGVSHYGMKMKVVVHSQADFDKWIHEQKGFVSAEKNTTVEKTTPLLALTQP